MKVKVKKKGLEINKQAPDIYLSVQGLPVKTLLRKGQQELQKLAVESRYSMECAPAAVSPTMTINHDNKNIIATGLSYGVGSDGVIIMSLTAEYIAK